jgi:hypothetical protein
MTGSMDGKQLLSHGNLFSLTRLRIALFRHGSTNDIAFSFFIFSFFGDFSRTRVLAAQDEHRTATKQSDVHIEEQKKKIWKKGEAVPQR